MPLFIKMIRQYAHLPLDEPVEYTSASYWVSKEEVVPYKDREVLCITRETSPITCCAGCSPGFSSILIPGFIEKLKYKRREDGLFVSDVEPIEDEDMMEDVRKIIRERYDSIQVEFFCP